MGSKQGLRRVLESSTRCADCRTDIVVPRCCSTALLTTRHQGRGGTSPRGTERTLARAGTCHPSLHVLSLLQCSSMQSLYLRNMLDDTFKLQPNLLFAFLLLTASCSLPTSCLIPSMNSLPSLPMRTSAGCPVWTLARSPR